MKRFIDIIALYKVMRELPDPDKYEYNTIVVSIVPPVIGLQPFTNETIILSFEKRSVREMTPLEYMDRDLMSKPFIKEWFLSTPIEITTFNR